MHENTLIVFMYLKYLQEMAKCQERQSDLDLISQKIRALLVSVKMKELRQKAKHSIYRSMCNPALIIMRYRSSRPEAKEPGAKQLK